MDSPGREVGAATEPHWERGFRCHGYWIGLVRWGMVGLPPRAGVDAPGEGRYGWVFEPHGITGQRPVEGRSATLRVAKKMVEEQFRRFVEAGNCITDDTKSCGGTW